MLKGLRGQRLSPKPWCAGAELCPCGRTRCCASSLRSRCRAADPSCSRSAGRKENLAGGKAGAESSRRVPLTGSAKALPRASWAGSLNKTQLKKHKIPANIAASALRGERGKINPKSNLHCTSNPAKGSSVWSSMYSLLASSRRREVCQSGMVQSRHVHGVSRALCSTSLSVKKHAQLEPEFGSETWSLPGVNPGFQPFSRWHQPPVPLVRCSAELLPRWHLE